MKDVNGNEWRCQLKVDGYRAIVHINDGDVTVFSRAGNEITESLPELKEMDWPNRNSYILDGEIIAENSSYSDTSSRIGRTASNVDRNVEMEYAAFDCVIYQGDDISEWEYNDRFDAVAEIVNSVDDDRLWLPKLWQEYEPALEMVSQNEEEGLIIKRMDATYEFGKRSDKWCKIKMDAETADVRISGFEEAEGDKSGTLGAVALESADGTHVGKSGSGFSDAQRENIWNNQDDWIGRTIEVEARGVGSQGNLRMPIFKRDRSQDGEPDNYERICEIMKEI